MSGSRGNRYAVKIAIGLCLSLLVQHAAAQFIEISADIEITSHRSDVPNAEATSTPRTFSVLCIIGTNQWRIENDWSRGGLNKWLFDGTNIYESLQVIKPPPEDVQEHLKATIHFATVPFEQARSNLTINIWNTRDGN